MFWDSAANVVVVLATTGPPLFWDSAANVVAVLATTGPPLFWDSAAANVVAVFATTDPPLFWDSAAANVVAQMIHQQHSLHTISNHTRPDKCGERGKPYTGSSYKLLYVYAYTD